MTSLIDGLAPLEISFELLSGIDIPLKQPRNTRTFSIEGTITVYTKKRVIVYPYPYRTTGRFHGMTPRQAALKAYTRIMNGAISIPNTADVVFTLRETTSSSRVVRKRIRSATFTYRCTRVVSEKKVTRGLSKYVVKYINRIKSERKEDSEEKCLSDEK